MFCWQRFMLVSSAALIFWGVWKQRNNRIWENKFTQAQDVAFNLDCSPTAYIWELL